MSKRRHKPEEIVAKLRQVDVLTAQGRRFRRRKGGIAKRSPSCEMPTGGRKRVSPFAQHNRREYDRQAASGHYRSVRSANRLAADQFSDEVSNTGASSWLYDAAARAFRWYRGLGLRCSVHRTSTVR
jgi:hypothetical protein